MILRYSYPRLTFLIGNSFLKAAVQRGWVGVGFAAGAELVTEAMNSHNKREEIKVCAEENRKTASMLPEKERTPFLKRQQTTIDHMSRQPSHGIITSLIHSETATTMTGQATTVLGKLGQVFGGRR